LCVTFELPMTEKSLDFPLYRPEPTRTLPSFSRELGCYLEIVLFLAACFVFILGRSPAWRGIVDNIAINFLAIILEAMPFMLIGSLAGGLIEVFVPAAFIDRVLRRRPLRAILLAGVFGFVVPVCECAIVPVVRRLLGKGVPLGAAVTFLLAGPIVNPLVLWSTAVAYSYEWSMVGLRLGGGYLIAVVIGLATAAVFRRGNGLKAQLPPEPFAACGCSHDLGQDGQPLARRLYHAVEHAGDDFFSVGRFLIIGALVAAVLRSSVSLDTFTLMAAAPWLAILAMMALAVLLNLCSEADAFIAVTFRELLPASSQLAFMLLGPMFDLKLLLMYVAVFDKKLILWLCLTVPLLVFTATMGLQAMAPGLR
jgi:uncharacterized membrane protein YraQ (UPF0718 family)